MRGYETLLRHFSESILHNIVTHTPSTAAFDKQITDSLVYYCFSQQHNPRTANITLEEYKQWQTWKSKITRSQSELPFHLCFQLNSPAAEEIDNWEMQFLVSSKQDPSLKLPLADYWPMKEGTGDWGLGIGDWGLGKMERITDTQ